MLDVKETNLLISSAKSGDNSAKEKLLTENANLIKSIVRRYLGKGVEYDDLYQLASMGLLKAINGFDESFGVRFSTYAVPMIAGEITAAVPHRPHSAKSFTSSSFTFLCSTLSPK